MLNLQSLMIEHFVKALKDAYQQTYSLLEPQNANILEWTGRLALENIANSDALYHNVDHTIMVTLVGQAILKGKHLCEGGITPSDWLHFMMALLCHDIGYVKGVCRHDGNGKFATGSNGETVELPFGSTDAALTPYHVNRSKLFVMERFGNSLVSEVDAKIIATSAHVGGIRRIDGEVEQIDEPAGGGAVGHRGAGLQAAQMIADEEGKSCCSWRGRWRRCGGWAGCAGSGGNGR